MFKKHSLAIALGALFAAPAFADPTAEGIIYQADQTNATASINQVIVEGNPQSAAILQLDSTTNGAGVNNAAVVIQGNVSGDGNGVQVDSTGITGANDGANAGTVIGAGEVVPFTAPDLTAYVDQKTGTQPFQSTIIGTDSKNYALIYQDHQSGSNALAIQALGADLATQVPAQASLANGDIPANAGDIANPLAAGDGSVVSVTTDYVSGATVTSTFGTDGSFVVDFGASSGPATLSGGDAAASSSNVAVITQGAHLDFTIPNGGGTTVGADDSFDGSDVSNNVALAIQQGTNSYARIGQQGTLNSSIVFQTSDADGTNVAESYQYDNGTDGFPTQDFSLISQNGNFNVAQTYQSGTTVSSYVFQFGDGNTSVVDQAGGTVGGAVAFVYQSNNAGGAAFNSGNYASVYQHVTN